MTTQVVLISDAAQLKWLNNAFAIVVQRAHEATQRRRTEIAYNAFRTSIEYKNKRQPVAV